MIDRYLSIWEIAHRWHDVSPDISDPSSLPLNVQDTIRFICRGVFDRGLMLFEMVVMKSNEERNGIGSCSEIRQFYVSELPAELENSLYRKYDKNVLDAHFIECENLLDYCMNQQSEFPSCWMPLVSDRFLTIEEEPSNIEPPQAQPLRPTQIDKLVCQAIARTLWDIYPKLTIAAMTKHAAILKHGGGKIYKGKNTLRDWVREVSPENVRNNPGRPKNSKPSNDAA